MKDPITIRIELILKGKKQVQIAKIAGVTKSTISQVMSGRIKPSKKIIEAFRQEGIDLLGEETN